MKGVHIKHIVQSLLVNLAIAGAKGIAAFFTGSGSLLAETLHSLADCSNQLLLLLGVQQTRRPPDDLHPLGYGRALYFWSFMVALLLFSGGGIFSIYEGIHRIRHPEPITRAGLGLTILLFSLIMEGWATFGNVRELNRRRGERSFWRFLRETKDSDLVVVFGENSAAVLGLLCAILLFSIAALTGDGRYDGCGSLAIGAILIAVATFLAVEVKSLLVGESADPAVARAVRQVVPKIGEIEEILALITIQQGPGEAVVAMKIRLRDNLTTKEVCRAINRCEARIKERCPDVHWCFVEPDLVR